MSRLRPLLPQVTLLLVIGALAVAIGAASGEAPLGDRGVALELTVRARDMAFYVDGSETPNPRLELPADRKVRLTFVNDDRGVEHDLVLPELDRRTRVLPGDGSRQTITFRTPAVSSRSRYNCSLHLMMMQGEISVR